MLWGGTVNVKVLGRMGVVWARTLSCALAVASLVSSAGCSKTERYTYVDVRVGIDQATISPNQLSMIIRCEFRVLGADVTDAISIVRGCPENNLSYELGTLSWTSSASLGALQFQVQLFGVNRVVIGEGTSAPVPIAPGTHPKISMLVVGVLPPLGADGGTMDAATATDGGMDASADGSPSDSLADGGQVTDGPGPTDAAASDATTTDGGNPTDVAAANDASVTTDASSPTDGTTTDGSTTDGASEARPSDGSGDTATDTTATGDASDGPGGTG
jgi:hypothetical protein